MVKDINRKKNIKTKRRRKIIIIAKAIEARPCQAQAMMKEGPTHPALTDSARSEEKVTHVLTSQAAAGIRGNTCAPRR